MCVYTATCAQFRNIQRIVPCPLPGLMIKLLVNYN